jgi:arsenate reductase-like glutaredoxin family protein
MEGKMSNVVPLFKQETIDNHPTDDSNSETIAIAHILASCTQLGHTVKELSKQFGGVDHVIDGLGDAESKNRLKQVMKLSSEALATAMHELSQAIRKLPRLQIDAMADAAKGKVTAAMVSEARCIACNVKRIVKGVTPVVRG